jgi:hypothetical protein
MSTPTSVYRYFDLEGRIIYVGVTSRGPQRQAQHAVTAEWWPHVSAQDVEHLSTREAALKREKWLIERHRPPFNRQHNPAHEKLKATYLRQLQRAVIGACGFDGAVDCDEGDDCIAWWTCHEDWCGVPKCVQCHRLWHCKIRQERIATAWDARCFAGSLAVACTSPDPDVAALAASYRDAGLQLAALMRAAQAGDPMASGLPDWIERQTPTDKNIADWTAPISTEVI